MSNKINILSHNIKYLRKLQKISQEELAIKLGISRSNIAAYESKNVEPRLKTLFDIAKIFDINIKALVESKLKEGEDFDTFETKSFESPDISQSLDIAGNSDIDIFIDKSIKISKILEGFKTFYTFKKNNLKVKTLTTDKIIFDIDNFIKLIEYLLSHNETIIKVLSNNEGVENA